MDKDNVLIGKILTGVEVINDTASIRFDIKDEDSVVVDCYGDCCSITWIESVELPALGFPAIVVSVEDLEMPNLGDQPGHDVMAYYGCKIVTDRGEIVIDYRNDSNGYYGGSLDWPRGLSA